MRFQYVVIEVKSNATPVDEAEAMNALGAEGWELVSTVIHNGTCFHYFKRTAT